MIAAFDVDYKQGEAHSACIIFKDWEDDIPYKTYELTTTEIAAYEPGAFYKRELPCLVSLINLITEKITVYIVDGYVFLGDKKGLGYYLHKFYEEKIPVIGVAKTRFYKNNQCIEILRGESKNPLFISSIGVDLNKAAESVKKMHGAFRIPTLLK
ncbi:MAG: endonuclease V, partial [Bacteroidota bacterium]